MIRITKKTVIIYSVIYGIFYFFGFFAFIIFDITFFLNGFGVTSEDIVYIGRGHHVIYVDTQQQIHPVKFLDRYCDRSFAVTITSEDEIELISSERYHISMEGELLEEYDGNQNANRIRRMREFTSKSGNHYLLTYSFGRYKILKEGKNGFLLIYQMPLSEYIFMVLAILLTTGEVVCIIWMFRHKMIVFRNKANPFKLCHKSLSSRV